MASQSVFLLLCPCCDLWKMGAKTSFSNPLQSCGELMWGWPFFAMSSLQSCIFVTAFQSTGDTAKFGNSWLNQAHNTCVCLSTGRYFCQRAGSFVKRNGGKWGGLGFASLRVSQVPGSKVGDVSFEGGRVAVSFPAQWRKGYNGFCVSQLSVTSRGMWEFSLSQLIRE